MQKTRRSEPSPSSCCLIFDFDDLLCNSAPLHFLASHQVLAEVGVDFSPEPAFLMQLYGRPIPVVTDMIFDRYQITSISKHDYHQRRAARFAELVRTDLQPMPGMAHVTTLARDLQCPRALASSGHREYLEIGLARLGLTDFFATIVSHEDVQRGKPDPEVFLIAAARLGAAPAQCIVFEDSTVGIEAAKRAGMYAIAVQNPYSAKPQDLAQADCLLESLADVTSAMIERA